MPNISPTRFVSLRELNSQTQQQMGNMLGVTAKYVGMIERGEKEVSDESSLGLLFRCFEKEAAMTGGNETNRINEASPIPGKSAHRGVPVVGWAHAGNAASYDEIPPMWQSKVATDCADPKAFGIRLEGESMEPRFSEGDVLIVQPSEPAHSGCLAVAKFQNDGVIFRRLEMQGDRVILVALNERYPATTHAMEEFVWIYPVFARVSCHWRK